MNNVLLIYISGAATLIIGSAALITLSTNAGRTAELAQGVGAADITQRGTAGSALLALLRRLPFSKPLRRRLSSAGLKWDVAITELALTGATVGIFFLSRLLVGHIAGAIFAVLILALFFRWLRRRRDQRVERFIAQLPEVSRVLSNGTSAGMSVERALVLAALTRAQCPRAHHHHPVHSRRCARQRPARHRPRPRRSQATAPRGSNGHYWLDLQRLPRPPHRSHRRRTHEHDEAWRTG